MRRFLPHILAALVAATVLLMPAAAGAAYTASAGALGATLIGSDADETLVVGEDGGKLTHNRAQPGDPDPGFHSRFDWDSSQADNQELPADGSRTLMVNAGGGDDVVRFVSGGVTRAVVDGTDGFDRVEIDGAPVADDFTVRPQSGVVHVRRTNPSEINLSVGTAERLVVNGLGGADSVAADDGVGALTRLDLDGGPGADALTGADGDDEITGGDGQDDIKGRDGDDRVAGGRGDDTVHGGFGDDRLIWNAGDGGGTLDGDAGHDVAELTGTPLRDEFRGGKLTHVQGGVATMIAPDADLIRIHALGGNDEVDFGLKTAAELDGGPGDDLLRGGGGEDVLRGGAGNDTLQDDHGVDLLDGGDGDDLLRTRDGVGDLVWCGPGNDDARVDLALDTHAGCESVNDPYPPPRPPLPPPAPVAAPALVYGELNFRAKRATMSRGGRVAIPVQCPVTATGGCHGEVSLHVTLNFRPGSARAAAVDVFKLPFASRMFNFSAGQRGRVTLNFSAAKRTLLRGRKSVKAGLQLRSVGCGTGPVNLLQDGVCRTGAQIRLQDFHFPIQLPAVQRSSR